MRLLLFLLSLCWLCSCNTLYVAQNKNAGNTKSIGVEWSYGDVPNEALQRSLDSALAATIQKFNAESHSFTVAKRSPRDKDKDYLSVDFEKGKVVGTGGKIAGYVVTGIGLATPVVLALLESPVIFAFYYWPEHSIRSKVTLSANLSDERKNNKLVQTRTGALFAANKTQVPKLIKKYADNFYKVLIDVEMQLAQH